jgi:hypothetical protein
LKQTLSQRRIRVFARWRRGSIKPSDIIRAGTVVFASLVLLAGCVEPQPIGAPGVLTQNRTPLKLFGRRSSGSESGLIYVFRNELGGTGNIFAYPSGQLVGEASIPVDAEGACADARGDVFVGGANAAGNAEIVEYSYGATAPSASVSVGTNDVARSCSVDALTGNVAVAIRNDPGGFNVVVLPHFTGKPKTYGLGSIASVAYDGSGDLFVLQTWPNQSYSLQELPNGSTGFQVISLNLGPDVALVRTVQWDGKYLTIEANDGGKKFKTWTQVIYRLTVSKAKAKVEQTITLDNSLGVVGSGTSWIQPSLGIIEFSTGSVRIWKYPSGKGKPQKIRSAGYYSAVAVSQPTPWLPTNRTLRPRDGVLIATSRERPNRRLQGCSISDARTRSPISRDKGTG